MQIRLQKHFYLHLRCTKFSTIQIERKIRLCGVQDPSSRTSALEPEAPQIIPSLAERGANCPDNLCCSLVMDRPDSRLVRTRTDPSTQCSITVCVLRAGYAAQLISDSRQHIHAVTAERSRIPTRAASEQIVLSPGVPGHVNGTQSDRLIRELRADAER